MGNAGANGLGSAAALRFRGAAERARTLYYIAAAVLAALVPLILFAGLWVRTVMDDGERDLRDFLIGRSDALSARIDVMIEQQLSIMAAVASIQSLDASDLGRLQETASQMAAAFPTWASVAIIDPATGHQLASTLHPSAEDPQPTTQPGAVARVASTRKPAVTTRYPGEGRVYGQGGVFLYMPVIRDNAVRVVLVVGLKADTVQELVGHEKDDNLLMVVVDGEDRILARSRGIDRFFGQQANAELRNATAGSDGGLFTARTLDDRQVFTAFRRSALTGWRAVVATESSRLDALGERSTWALIGTGAFSLTLAGVLAVFLFYSVVERRVTDERLAASRALSALDARLLATTQDALDEQRKSASEREVLLREIYHRVKNNLQIIQSLLRLGGRDLQPDQREPFEAAIRRIGAMARVHSLLYKSPDLASIDFKDYLEDLVRETAEGFGADERDITTEFDVQSMRVPLDTAVPLAFVTVEILTNAFKHAFPDGRQGRISIATRQEGEYGVLTIADNGIGLHEQPGTRRQLGLNLVNKLVEQIGGTLERPPPGGSTYRVKFPLNPPSTGPLPLSSRQS